MLSASTYEHMKVALQTGILHAKEIGTDFEIAQAEYALKLLEHECRHVYTEHTPFTKIMAEECAQYGCD